MPAPSLDELVRNLIREETGQQAPVSPPPPRQAVRRERWVLLLMAGNAGFLLALFPNLDEAIKPLWTFCVFVCSSALGFGYAWWRERLQALMRDRAMVAAAATVFTGLLAVHVVRNVPLVPVSILPANAIVYLDGTGPLDVSPSRVTMRAHRIDVRPWAQWPDAMPQSFEITVRQAALALIGADSIVMPLLCDAVVDTPVTESDLSIEIVPCTAGDGPAGCRAGEFGREYLRLLPENSQDFLDGGRVVDARRLVFTSVAGNDVPEPILPVGRYMVTASKAGCESQERLWTLEAERCAPVMLDAMSCRS